MCKNTFSLTSEKGTNAFWTKRMSAIFFFLSFVFPSSLYGSHSLVPLLLLNVALLLYFQTASLKLHLTEVSLFTLKVESGAAIRALVCYCTDIK